MANLITLSEVKAYKQINSDNSDVIINLLIPKVSLLVKNYVGRSIIDFYSTEKEQYFNGSSPILYLQEVPLNEVSSVEYSNDYGKTYVALEQYVDYTVDLESDAVNIISLATEKRPNSFKVVYTGGYQTIPDDLKLAVLDLVDYYMKSDMSVKSTRNAGANNALIEYVMNATLPAHIRRVLDTYRVDL